MPIINVNLIKGRSEEQLKNLVKDITTVVSKDTGAPEEHIHVILNEMRKDRYSVGGKLKSEEN